MSAIIPIRRRNSDRCSAAHIAFGANDPNPPGIGDLPRGTYAFAAAAKAADCGVIGVGCAVVDVSSSSGVSITLHANDPPTGACASARSVKTPSAFRRATTTIRASARTARSISSAPGRSPTRSRFPERSRAHRHRRDRQRIRDRLSRIRSRRRRRTTHTSSGRQQRRLWRRASRDVAESLRRRRTKATPSEWPSPPRATASSRSRARRATERAASICTTSDPMQA